MRDEPLGLTLALKVPFGVRRRSRAQLAAIASATTAPTAPHTAMTLPGSDGPRRLPPGS